LWCYCLDLNTVTSPTWLDNAVSILVLYKVKSINTLDVGGVQSSLTQALHIQLHFMCRCFCVCESSAHCWSRGGVVQNPSLGGGALLWIIQYFRTGSPLIMVLENWEMFLLESIVPNANNIPACLRSKTPGL
jgi:hypothetical protein